jgi:hypothetical protein
VRKKLLLLDLALAAVAVVLALQVRDKWFEARKREQVVLGQKVAPLPAPPFKPLPQAASLRPSEYAAVAEKFLFSADRNSTVIVEVKAVKPKIMPALPVYFGVMDLGEGPMAIMSVKNNEQPREVHFGEKVGEFTLVSAVQERVVLEWDGKKIEKTAAELAPQETAPERAAAAQAASAASSQRSAAASVPTGPVEAAPGKETGGGYHACVAGDASPAGTVRDGMKKVVSASPFGSMCRWEPVK